MQPVLHHRTRNTIIIDNYYKLNTNQRSLPSESNSRSVNQDFSELLWNRNVCYRVYESPPLVPVPSQIHTADAFLLHFHQISSTAAPPPTGRFTGWSLPQHSSNKILYIVSSIPCVLHVSEAKVC